MYSYMVTNEVGEPLGVDYYYDDDPFYSLSDDYDPVEGDYEEIDCPGHPTAEETSGDAHEREDGTWECDLGPCPSAN